MPIPFKEIRIDDKPDFEQYILSKSRICDRTFANLFCWQQHYGLQWAIVEDRLVVRCHIYGERHIGYMILPDIMTPKMPALLSTLEEDNMYQGVTLINLAEEETLHLQNILPGKYVFDHNRDFDDYLYLTENFKEYRGKKLAAKRNHVNKFQSLYQWTYAPLTPDKFEDCMRVETEWRRNHSNDTSQLDAELQVIQRAFNHFEALELIGGTLYVDGKLAAFSYGSALDSETFCTHIEKADIRYEGVFPMMAQQLVLHLPEQFIYLDREEDMGLPGLRKSKESFHPLRLEPKYNAIETSASHQEIIHVWQECFGDDVSFIQTFLSRYYFSDSVFTHEEDGHIVGICFIVLCDTEIGTIGYLYAIGTLPAYRGKGIANKLVREAIAKCRKQQLAAVALIPADEGLKQYYRRFGFGEQLCTLHFVKDFDLGTGNPENDKAIFIPLQKDVVIPETLNCAALM